MIEIYFKTIRDAQFKRIEDIRAGSWLYLRDATLDDLQQLATLTGLELSDVRDSLDKYELPRIERVSESVILFIRHPSELEAGLYTSTLAILLTNTYLVAISPARCEIVETLLTQHTPFGTTQKSKLLLHILLKITQEFTASIKRARHATLEHEQATKTIDNEAIAVLTKNEEILNQYLTALVPLRNVLEAMETGRYINLYEKDYDLLEDLMIAIQQSEDLCRVNVKSIRSLRDSFQIIFTNDVNRTIKRLTALTIIFTIPTILASIYGMNVQLPFQDKPYAFFLVINITIVFSFIAVLFFLRKRWL